jgi:hypothetical protein
MNESIKENGKKAALGAVILIALGFAIYEGIGLVSGPQLIPVKKFGEGKPGHGMKAAMMAHQKELQQGKVAP